MNDPKNKDQDGACVQVDLRINFDCIINLQIYRQSLQFKMDAGMRKAFHVKVGSLVRTLKEFKSYRAEVEAYNLNEVSQDKKKQEFYLESKSALDQVEKKLIDFYQQLKAYISQNQDAIESEEEAMVKTDYETAKGSIQQVQSLLPAAC